jgi:hypothetical protein
MPLEAVIKIGGSLAKYPNALTLLCEKLPEFFKKCRFLIVPGGGAFTDVVKNFYRKFSLPELIAHRMAILAMDQFGFFLSAIIPSSRLVYSLNEAKTSDILPILLPSHLLFHVDIFEPSWKVTSDSIAAFVTDLLRVPKLILVTDVDGIYTADPKKNPKAKLIKGIKTEHLLKLGRTCVDETLPSLLSKFDLECYVVNGKYVERIGRILEGKSTICTKIIR